MQLYPLLFDTTLPDLIETAPHVAVCFQIAVFLFLVARDETKLFSPTKGRGNKRARHIFYQIQSVIFAFLQMVNIEVPFLLALFSMLCHNTKGRRLSLIGFCCLSGFPKYLDALKSVWILMGQFCNNFYPSGYGLHQSF